MRHDAPDAGSTWPPDGFLDALSGMPLNPGGREFAGVAFTAAAADPSRRYREGRRTAMVLDAARATVAQSLGLRPAEVSFDSSAASAAHRAIAGRVRARPGALVASAVEHSAVLRAADRHEETGGSVRIVGVDRQGRVDTAAFLAEIARGDVTLACLQSYNHEVGTRQPLEVIAPACRAAGVPLLVDVSTSLGRIADPAEGDILVGAASGWGGPAGVGVLGIRTAVAWTPPSPLDEREAGRVPGLPAVALIAIAARALEWALAQGAADADAIRDLRDRLSRQILATIPGVTVLGDPDDGLPYLLALSCDYTSAEALVDGLDAAGFAVSSGSSCVADTRRPSHVLQAMGVPTGGNLRLTLPLGSRDRTVAGFVDALAAVVAAEREHLGATDLL